MPAFDNAFDSAAFDGSVSGGGGAVIATGSVSLGLDVGISNPAFYSSAAGSQNFGATVIIDGVDLSSQLTGKIDIAAAEDSARTVSLSLVPPSSAFLASVEGATLTIDLAIQSTTGAALNRVFTGHVETLSYAPGEKIATLSGRDGWQERPKACTSAAEVEAMFGGRAKIASTINAWNVSEPDPQAYFNNLLATLPGATAIGGDGLWRVIPWQIGSPLASFTAADVVDNSLAVTFAHRADLPAAITATLNHRHPRLHQVEIPLIWSAVTPTEYVTKGVPALNKATIQAALSGLSEWHIKGSATLTSPTPGSYPVIVGGNTVYYTVSDIGADLLCDAMSATLYRRWYQEVETSYVFTITLPGSSDRQDSIAATITSSFDGSAWETTPSNEATISIYARNAPAYAPGTAPSGYEGLLAPLLPANIGTDYWSDLGQADLDAAMDYLVAQAVRQAAKGLRYARVAFSRPLDLRFDLGDTLAVDCYGVQALGQVYDLRHEIDFDAGFALTTFTLATPAALDSLTASTATVTAPAGIVSHALMPPTLGNQFGASTSTPTTVNESALQGFLFNVLPTGNGYSASAPAYQEQFRILMPAIDASDRDGLNQIGTVNASVSIAGLPPTITV